MADIKNWSAVADDNTETPPDGWPEGMLRSDVNNAARECMRAIRKFYAAGEWVDVCSTTGDSWTPSQFSATQVLLTAADGQTTDISSTGENRYPDGTRVKLSGGASPQYGFVTSSSFSTPNTYLTIDVDGGASIDASTDTVEISFMRDAIERTAYYPTGTTLAQDPPYVPTIDDLGNGATVDMGTGNGFDADTVDGYHYSDILTNAAGVNPNLVYNAEFSLWQRGSTIDNDTTSGRIYVNDNAGYTADRWMLLAGNGATPANDLVDVSQDTTSPPSGYHSCLKMTANTIAANDMAGIFQILENRDSAALIGSSSVSLGVSLKGTGGALNCRFMLLGWTGTADTVTADPISDWGTPGDGTGPTFATNWTKLFDSGQLTLAASTWTREVVENQDISAATTVKNFGILIYIDDASWAATDTLSVTGVKLENGSVSSTFQHLDQTTELMRCQRYFLSSFKNGSNPRRTAGLGECITGVAESGESTPPYHMEIISHIFPVEMFQTPTVTCFNPTTDTASQLRFVRNAQDRALTSYTQTTSTKMWNAYYYDSTGTYNRDVIFTGITVDAEFS